MRISAAFAALTLTAALSACSADTDTDKRAVDPSAGTDATAAPTPVADGSVSTTGLVTVLKAGASPQMCLGAIAESSPPQCTGREIELEGLAWSPADLEQAGGVEWGSYAITGTFDGTIFTVTDSIPAALYDVAATPDPAPLAAACDSPASTDPDLASPKALDATMTAVAALPGYASVWLTGKTINVAVTEDAAGAETTLRETWGGPLCVTTAEHTEAELNAIGQEMQAGVPSLLSSSSPQADAIEAEVVFDDGSIQAWADKTYGKGLVRITSALVPA